MLQSPIRCTQNPTMGEEWRRGWHPERPGPLAPPAAAPVLVVGGGPAGLEAAATLVARGYDVTLADCSRELGGRTLRESALPGLSSYRRVSAHRLGRLRASPRATLLPGGDAITAATVLEAGFSRVLVATGSRWRDDGVGRSCRSPLRGLGEPGAPVAYGPEALMDGGGPVSGRVVLFDDDHYFIGGVLAELLLARGATVTVVTTAPLISAWTANTLEQSAVQARLLRLGATLLTQTRLVAAAAGGAVRLACTLTGREWAVAADSLVLVTERVPLDGLATDLARDPAALAAAGVECVRAIGDCLAPGTVAAAVYSGHLAARELDGGPPQPPLRERIALG